MIMEVVSVQVSEDELESLDLHEQLKPYKLTIILSRDYVD